MTQSNPFQFDASKFFATDPKKLMEEWTKSLEKFKVGNVDVQAILDSQRKNVEAVSAANKVALEGIQAVMKRQSEIAQQAVEEVSKLVGQFDAKANPAETVAKQTELVKEAFEKALSNMKELAEMAGKSNGEALETIQKRFTESLEELKAQVLAAKK